MMISCIDLNLKGLTFLLSLLSFSLSLSLLKFILIFDLYRSENDSDTGFFSLL